MGKEISVYTRMAIRKIAKEIINLKVGKKDTIDSLYEKFYNIMRKYGIKIGEKSDDGPGITMANPEWTLFKVLFEDTIRGRYLIKTLIDYPKDLESY
jgi:hypothetical protein